MPQSIRQLYLFLAVLGFISFLSNESHAQAPWQVPAAYWETTYCYYPPSSQAAVVAPADCCCCCCCRNPADPNGSNSVTPPKPQEPEDPPEDETEPDNTDQANLASFSYALQRVRAVNLNRSPHAPITGIWHSKFGKVNLRRKGTAVSGTIEYKRGGIIDVEGRYQLGVLTLTYQNRSQPQVRGRIALHYDARSGQFIGRSKNSVSGQQSDWSLSRT
jgi:hypothetical protein